MHFSTLSLTSVLVFLPVLASATCYNTGLRFGELRGKFDKTADIDTARAMVDTFCGKLDGSVYYPGTGSWTACASTDVVRGVSDSAICGQLCRDGCAALRGGGRVGGESAGAFCAAGCEPCPPKNGDRVSPKTSTSGRPCRTMLHTHSSGWLTVWTTEPPTLPSQFVEPNGSDRGRHFLQDSVVQHYE